MKHDLFCTWSDICEVSSFSENPIEATIMITSDISSIIMFIYLLSYLLIGIDEEEYKNWKSEREATKKKNATCIKCKMPNLRDRMHDYRPTEIKTNYMRHYV